MDRAPGAGTLIRAVSFAAFAFPGRFSARVRRVSPVVLLWAMVACGGDPDAGTGGGGSGGGVPSGDVQPPDDVTPAPELSVLGNRIVTANGQPVHLHGVNRSGTEFACVQGHGIFDGRADNASLAAIRSWNANAVRVPMNEDCWLDINGVDPSYAGAAYQRAILDYVARILAWGLTPIVELHWSAPGTTQATQQTPMPNRDHTPAFWSDVARRFAGDQRVVLELFNEPYPAGNRDNDEAWRCWRDGGTCTAISYQVAGMQELVNAVRAAGALNVILLGGVQYSNTLTGWLAYKPDDATGNLAAAWHVYDFNACSTTACWDTVVGAVAAAVPVVTTEIGQRDAADFAEPLMTWLDEHDTGYLAWTWNTWGDPLSLIVNYDGTPSPVYGTIYRTHLGRFAP